MSDVPFISHEDLGAYLETTFTGGELLVKIALTGACEAVRRELYREVNLVEDDEVVLDGNNTDALILPERPVHEVSNVTMDGEAVADEDLYLDIERGILFLTSGAYWSRGKGNIELTYTHGYALDEPDVDGTIERVPANIRLVALRLAAAVYRSKGIDLAASTGVVSGESIGTYKYTQEVDVQAVSDLASTLITDNDRMSLHSQRSVYVA